MTSTFTVDGDKSQVTTKAIKNSPRLLLDFDHGNWNITAYSRNPKNV